MCSACDPAALLAEQGLRATANRLAVLAALLEACEALAPLTLLERVRRQRPMDKVTLYRTLEALCAHGLASRHEAGDGPARYCAVSRRHPAHQHFYCRQCRRLICLEPDAVTTTAKAPEGASLLSVEVRLEGRCPACQ